MSDGTIDEGSGSSLNADTYEILDEGYLKWGKYDGSWIEYKYTYWKVKLDGNTLTLTLKNNPDYILVFTKVKK